jgi:hypothetical protein
MVAASQLELVAGVICQHGSSKQAKATQSGEENVKKAITTQKF